MGDTGTFLKRRLPGAIIVLAWLILVGVLIARQHAGKPAASPGDITPALLHEEWMAIRFHGEKAGWGHSEYKPIEGGYSVLAESFISIMAMGTKQEAQTTLHAEVGPDFSMKKFSFEFHSPAQNLHVEGEVDDLTLKVRIGSAAGAKPEERKIKLKEPITLLDTVVLSAAKQGLKVGEKIRVSSFDPTTQSADYSFVEVVGREEIEIMGKRINAYVLQASFLGVEVRSWVDEKGHTLRDESPLGFVTELTTKAEAMKNLGAAKLDVIAEAAIPVNRLIPDPRNTRYLKIRLSGVESIDSPDISGGVQNVSKESNSAIILTIRIPEPGAGYSLPDADPGRAAERAPELLLQSDDQEIGAAAKKIVGPENNSVNAAKLLNDWLYTNIKKEPTLSLPSAKDVWKTKTGDCNEHTTLYTALARAIGLPARMAAGVVYLNGSFYYHAWPEVWLGDSAGWTPVDPTFGEFPADATHIRLTIGGLKNQLAISRFLGKLKIEILDI